QGCRYQNNPLSQNHPPSSCSFRTLPVHLADVPMSRADQTQPETVLIVQYTSINHFSLYVFLAALQVLLPKHHDF
ncbi:MAG: hypothetical protein ACI4MJ_02725, partial [Aristaeellaceae bacterium]